MRSHSIYSCFISMCVCLRPKADKWRLVHIGGLSCSQPLNHGRKRSSERSPVAVTKPRTSHSRIIVFIPRLRQNRSCTIHVGRMGGDRGQRTGDVLPSGQLTGCGTETVQANFCGLRSLSITCPANKTHRQSSSVPTF